MTPLISWRQLIQAAGQYSFIFLTQLSGHMIGNDWTIGWKTIAQIAVQSAVATGLIVGFRYAPPGPENGKSN